MFQITNWHLQLADGILMPSLRKYSSLAAIPVASCDPMKNLIGSMTSEAKKVTKVEIEIQ